MLMKFFLKYRLKSSLYPSVFVILVVAIIVLFCLIGGDGSDAQIKAALQMLGSFIGVFATFFIFARSRDDSDRQNLERQKHQRSLHDSQMTLLKSSAEKQMNLFQRALQEQTESIVDAIKNQSSASASDSKTAEAVQRTYELSKLDYEIEKNEMYLYEAEEEMELIKEFTFLRTNAERKSEIEEQLQKIKGILSKIESLKEQKRNLE